MTIAGYEQAVLTEAIASQDSLSCTQAEPSGAPASPAAADSRERIQITLPTRLGWYQVSMLDLGDPDLDTHMHNIALDEWRRFHGWRTVRVIARDLFTGLFIEVVRGETVPPCPQCGYTR